jgi:hypothetical protein
MPGVFVKAHRVADGYPVITGAKHNKRCYDNGSNGAESNAGQDTVLKVDRLFNKARRSVATPQAQVARALSLSKGRKPLTSLGEWRESNKV